MEQSAGGLGCSPNPIDRHVGLRIRLRRKELGVSQERLAESIGLTFQQIQKYERAANRVSASKLWELAGALQISVAYFYEGLDLPGPFNGRSSVDAAVRDFMLTDEGAEMAAMFPRIRERRMRRKILELIRLMADDQDEDEDADAPEAP
jgi:transcriptional regulator with XRE-family HTH domain